MRIVGMDKMKKFDLKCDETRKVLKGINIRHVRPLSKKKRTRAERLTSRDAGKAADYRKHVLESETSEASEEEDEYMPLEEESEESEREAKRSKEMSMLDGLAAEEAMVNDAEVNDVEVQP